ncbi:MAG TPA: OmpA family protein [Anaeromyxobacteraceae bacterium]|nr:OmpA family protein [Anaeromyxobacteraceae bacterium]
MVGLSQRGHEEDEDISSFWLITYSDMVTLLLTFFLLMYSFSVMSQDRKDQLVERLRGVVDEKGQEVKSRAELEEAARQIAQQLDKAAAFVESNETEVTVGLSSAVTFASGDAVLAPAGGVALVRAAQILKGLPNVVRIEGHTDNVPMRGARFQSNWELSAARAQTVVRVFMQQGLDPRRIQVIGYADVRPRQANDTAEGRAANRRIEIKLLKGTE